MPVDRKSGYKLLVWEGLLSWVPFLGQYWYLRRARIEYLRQLITEYRGLLNQCDGSPDSLTPEQQTEVNSIIETTESSPGLARWDDVYVLQQVLLRMYSHPRVTRSIWHLRSCFREVAGAPAYADYLASNPPNPDDEKTDPSAVRADAEQLMTVIQWYQTMRSVLERERNHLARRLATLTVLLCLAGGVILFFTQFYQQTPADAISAQATSSANGPPRSRQIVLGVLFAGALGGLVSTQQRLHGLPSPRNPATRLLTLSQSWYTVYYAPIMGALGAVVLVVLFSSGMIQGDLFPKFATTDHPDGATLVDLARMSVNNTKDLAKVLVWSFLAGFSERLVPDTLDRLASRVGGKGDSEAPRTPTPTPRPPANAPTPNTPPTR